MDKTKWDMQEVKQLKKKQLIQSNLVMFLLFMALIYFANNGKHFLIVGMFFIVILIVLAITLYTLKTGKPVGTKTSKLVQEFDRNRLGEKRWKRNRTIEAFVVGIIGIGIAVLLFITDFNSVRMGFPVYHFPFVGAWVGHNLGEIVRISNLPAD